jgi:transcriptional regulator with XRE-family HTH domain
MPVKPEDRGEAAKLRRVLGARVREAREALGWSQEKLAEEVGVGVETLGRYERASKFPSHVTLVRLARVLRRSTDTLLGLTANSAAQAERSDLDEVLTRLTASQQAAVVHVIRELTVPYGNARGRTSGTVRRPRSRAR